VISAAPLAGIGELHPGDDLGSAVVAALAGQPVPTTITSDHVLVVAHKAVSKVEGRFRSLADVTPGPDARALAIAQGKDPRLVEIIFEESRGIVRAANGVIITETHHGFICANAGVDASNVRGDDVVLLLPRDPDASARALRARLGELTGAYPAVVITDSFGRAWRTGQCDVAIGVAGLRPLEDWRGASDSYGRELHATVIAVADQLAAVADLARRKDSQEPVVLVSGAERHVVSEDGPGVAPLIRAREHDLFR
jgi:coenzyme F420-0:L-glutamate ligase / coenzyme F420-1:gamma-L-glutamate ligase